jgi:5-methylcytosine-specific restriction endonuclease McrA
LELLKKIENKSAREARKIVFEIAPELKKPDVGFHQFDDDLRAKLEKVRGLLAHKEGNLTLVQLLHKLCDEKLESKLPATSRVKKEVRLRDRYCVNCGSTHALEVDHIIPRALGGTDEPGNLRLLCRSCNQRAAIRYFGTRMVGKYFKSDPTVNLRASRRN